MYMSCKWCACHDWPERWYLTVLCNEGCATCCVKLWTADGSRASVSATACVATWRVTYKQYCMFMLCTVKNLNTTFLFRWMILFFTQPGCWLMSIPALLQAGNTPSDSVTESMTDTLTPNLTRREHADPSWNDWSWAQNLHYKAIMATFAPLL